MSCSIAEAQDILDTSDCIFSMAEVDKALVGLAAELKGYYDSLNPLVICVMNGGLVFTGQLLPKLHFHLEIDYLHATRYRQNITGQDVSWPARPHKSLEGRHVLIVDDIFDQGVTLAEVNDFCRQAGALSVRTVVLCTKDHNRQQSDLKVDYVALSVPDRYVFGLGMDYKGFHRNVAGIYACDEDVLRKYS